MEGEETGLDVLWGEPSHGVLGHKLLKDLLGEEAGFVLGANKVPIVELDEDACKTGGHLVGDGVGAGDNEGLHLLEEEEDSGGVDHFEIGLEPPDPEVEGGSRGSEGNALALEGRSRVEPTLPSRGGDGEPKEVELEEAEAVTHRREKVQAGEVLRDKDLGGSTIHRHEGQDVLGLTGGDLGT